MSDAAEGLDTPLVPRGGSTSDSLSVVEEGRSPVTKPPEATHTPYAAVLWDMDGTLVDTEPYWIAAEHAIVAEHGGT